ncbi:MAG: segregation/condensation protein A [Hormoscilla sp. GUM202]|nr:segregation/condensation protein A [Hormoscilla sp. GUM202]
MRDSQITYRPEEIGIALLIDMAQRGEIDPWDVQVIDVIDRVLSQLRAPNSNDDTTTVEAELSQSGQVFLYASMLVLLKADSLAPAPESSEMFPEALESEDSSDGSLKQKLPLPLERQLRRRAVARPPQQRRVTLQELIDQLQLMTKTIAQQQKRIPTRRKSSLSRAEAADAITQLAHQENLSEVAEQLEYFLANNWSKMAQGSDWLDLEQLLAWQPQQDKVGVFWALLLLSAQSKVELAQEEFYQDLKIRSTL